MVQNIPICQSCSMPIQKSGDFGTNADGSKSKDYCTFCYQGGKFTFQGTLDQMIERLVGMSGRMGMTEEQARAIARTVLPKLKRWRKK